MIKRCLLYVISCLSCFSLAAQPLAFPGAEGGGRFSVGGRAGTVYEVTNLNDSGTGSLRDAISAPNRTVVFRVSGVIHLASTLKFLQNNITVAGQTAPGDGICIAGYTVSVQANDIIIRHIRSRLGDDTLIEDDAMHSTGVYANPYQNIIIDHCSLSWSVDETGTFYDIRNFTLQWCILSESLYHSVHDKGDHGYAGIWGGNNATFHHNLLAHHTSRNPRFNGSRYSGHPDAEVVDFRNNVLYNWGNINSAYGGEGGNYNMVNNYYKPGPATPGSLNTPSISNKRNRILNYTSYYYASDAAVYPDTLFGGKFYIAGNYVKGFPTVTADNWTLGVQPDSYKRATQLIASAKQSSPFATPPVATQSAEEAYAAVLSSVGATLPARDMLDTRIIREVQTGTATFEGAAYSIITGTGISHPSGIIDTQTDVGGLPPYNSTTPPTDTDHDGMPDSWEIANSLNPNNAADGALIPGSGTYTNLELYLNSLIIVQPVVAVNGSLSRFNQILGNPSATQTVSVYGSNLTANILITPPAGFEISADGGSTWNNIGSPLTLIQSNGTIIETTIAVRLNGGAVGFYSGNITAASSGASNVNVPISGSTMSAISPPAGTAVTVAKDGSGNYTTVQAAIDAAPTGQASPYVIFIRKGIYKEKITVPSNKPFLQFVGESVSGTILTYDDYSGKAMPGGGTFGTSNSASVTINATDFSAMNITFANATGDAPQALAINVNADRAAFTNCRFLGGQDTVLSNGTGNHQYFRHTYIDGVVDFIFGNAITLFDSCIVYAKSREDAQSSSYMTAANTDPSQTYGYVFRNAILPSNTGVTKYYLGRPWQNATGFSPTTFPRVVFLNTTIGQNQIRPEGWSTWDAGTDVTRIYDGEYKSRKFNGNPVDVSSRVSWSFQLTDTQAAAYTNGALFGAWDPCALGPAFCGNVTSSIAVSNFKGKKGATTSSLTWNMSWAMNNVKFELFRSSDNISFSKVNEQTSVNDSTVNFNYSENIPPAGQIFYYFLVASKAGKEPHVTETINISSTPTITVTGAMNNFLQGLGSPSALQAYSVSGVNLSGDITIKPPIGYELSTDGTNWSGNSAPLILHQTSGTVASTSISVRLNASTVGNYSGSIVHTAAGAVTVQLAVNGALQQDALAVSKVIQYWPLSANSQDDPATRDAGVVSNVPTFKKLSVSNGTTVATIPAYSSTFGQAFGPGTGGDGNWSSSNGGPGGSLNRGIYEQFKITAASCYGVRVDSIVLKSSFYNTSSNTKLSVVYSKSGFTSNDSTDVIGGTGPNGQPLISTANGAFATPVLLTNETLGTTTRYAFSLNGVSGVQIAPGQSLTIRLYFSCSSSSTGRYAKVKDVYIKGFASAKPVLLATSSITAFTQVVGTPSTKQTYTVSGSNLTANITITPPSGFEISSDGGTTWKGPSAPISLTPVSAAVASTTISVRLNSTAKGSFSGNITHASTGADNVTVTLTGTATDPVTGIEPISTNEFIVSPNPAGSYLNIRQPSISGSYQIAVYSSLGQKLQTITTNPFADSQQIDLNGLSAGLYLVEWNNNGVRIIRRFIKQ